MIDFSLDTTEKVVSTIAGLVAIGGVFLWRRSKNGAEGREAQVLANSHSASTQTVAVHISSTTASQTTPEISTPSEVAEIKRSAHVLFVDDDRGFKIVGILKKMGWENTKLVADISSLEQAQLLSADVVFVDIQGVGRAMQYEDEGLGLALAIKRRHPKKKVVIYSAEEKGARFHEALQEADYSLPKTAEPIRFEDTIMRVLSK